MPFSRARDGGIVAGDVTLSAAKIDVDADGDGQPDAQVQIGPIIRGTSLRDSLPFISFTAYTNQVEFAQLANAFNDHAAAQALKGLGEAGQREGGRAVQRHRERLHPGHRVAEQRRRGGDQRGNARQGRRLAALLARKRAEGVQVALLYDDLGSFGTGGSKSVTFDKPGKVEVECAVHPDMRLDIEVGQ